MEIGIDKKVALTVDEAVKYSNIGENTLRTLMKTPEFEQAVFRVGRKLLIKRQYLEAYINDNPSVNVR